MRIISINKATSLDNMLLYKNTDPIIQKATGMYFNLKHLLGAMNGASETCRDNPPLFKKKGTQRTRLSQSSLKDSKMEKKKIRDHINDCLGAIHHPWIFQNRNRYM